nr:uncharacterized protein LOC109186805 [Ipomoea batatas]
MSEPKSEPSSISVSEKGVKVPNVFVRVKEEFEAVLHSHSENHGKGTDLDEKTPMSEVKAPNVFGRAKEEIEALVQTIHTKKESGGSDLCEELRDSSSNSETHGMSDDIDENTPVGNVKGPNVFARAKEEIEAIVEAIHPKKEGR